MLISDHPQTYIQYDVEGAITDFYPTLTSVVYIIGPGRMTVDVVITFISAIFYTPGTMIQVFTVPVL